MKRLLLANLRGNYRRMLLAALATLLGSAFVAGTLVLGDTLQATVDSQVVGNAAKMSAVATTDNQLRPLPAESLGRIAGLPGVRQADGMVSGDVTVLGADGRPRRDAPVGFSTTLRTTLSGGRLPAAGETVLADQTATALGVQIGGTVAVLDFAGGQPRQFRVSGTVNVRGQGDFSLHGAMGFTEADARVVTGKTGYAEIDVAGADPAALVPAMRTAIGNGPYRVVDGQDFAREQAAGSGVDPVVLRAGLVLFAIVALFVAGFVIYNTFIILVAQRTRELALTRCLGASRGQVFRAVLAESAIVGAVASLLGSALGVGVAWLLMPIVNSLGGAVAMDSLSVGPGALLLSFAAGTLATVGAALVPAWVATATKPVSALTAGQEPSAGGKLGWVRRVFAAGLSVAGLLAALAGLTGGNGQSGLVLVGLGGILVFLGTVAAGPALVRILVRAAGFPLRRALGVPGRLAAGNALRKPRRSATTALALVIGITLTAGITVITSSLESSVDVGIGQALPADFLIQRPGANNGPVIPRAVAGQLQAAPGAVVTEVREAPAVAKDGETMVSTLAGAIRPKVLSGSLDGLRDGGVALRPERAQDLGVRAGDTVGFRIGDRTVTMPVAAVVTGPVVPRMIVSPDRFDALFPGTGDALVLVDFATETSPADARAVVDAATAAFPTARVTSTYDAHDQLAQTLGQVTSFVTALLALAIVISLLGISNTMTLSVLERTRETAVLRALGFPIARIRGMLTTEALLLGLIGGVLGVVLGTAFGLAAAHVINTRITLSVPWGVLIALVAGAGAAAALASLLPTRNATRVSVVAALADE